MMVGLGGVGLVADGDGLRWEHGQGNDRHDATMGSVEDEQIPLRAAARQCLQPDMRRGPFATTAYQHLYCLD